MAQFMGLPCPPAPAEPLPVAPPAAPQRPDLPIAIAALIGEFLLVVAFVVLNLPIATALAGHGVIVGLMAWSFFSNIPSRADTTASALTLLATAIVGPIGAALALVSVPYLRSNQEAPDTLAAWYERIALAGDVDDITRLCDNVAIGRTIDTSTAPPRAFASVVAHGSLTDRQSVLGFIARRFHPTFSPALKAAMVSPEPVIRVQAAAVAVRLQGDLKAAFKAMMATVESAARDADRALALAAQMRPMLQSGLLDENDEKQCEAVLARLSATALDRATSEIAPNLLTSAEAVGVCEAELLRQERFAEFRALRLARARSDALVEMNTTHRTGAAHA